MNRTSISDLKAKAKDQLLGNYGMAKEWVKQKARGNERYGLLASSEGKRLRGEGIWVPADINHVGWFLNGKENVDSSFFSSNTEGKIATAFCIPLLLSPNIAG